MRFLRRLFLRTFLVLLLFSLIIFLLTRTDNGKVVFYRTMRKVFNVETVVVPLCSGLADQIGWYGYGEYIHEKHHIPVKYAYGYPGKDFDGRFAAIVGTHTHIPTADAQILPGGSAFVTDLGMCGPEVSVLGVRVQDSITRFRTRLPVYYAEGEGDALIQGVFVRVDPKTGKALEIRQILNRYPA